MKITKHTTLLLFIFATVLSCDKLDELTEFDVNDDFNTTVSISISEGSETFSESAIINIASNQEIQDNLDLIQNISINSITYQISNYNSTEDSLIMLTESTLSFGTISINVEDINLQQADSNNTVFTISNSQQFNSIGNLLENSTTINTMASGTVDGSPVSFDVIINVDLTVTIDVL